MAFAQQQENRGVHYRDSHSDRARELTQLSPTSSSRNRTPSRSLRSDSPLNDEWVVFSASSFTFSESSQTRLESYDDDYDLDSDIQNLLSFPSHNGQGSFFVAAALSEMSPQASSADSTHRNSLASSTLTDRVNAWRLEQSQHLLHELGALSDTHKSLAAINSRAGAGVDNWGLPNESEFAWSDELNGPARSSDPASYSQLHMIGHLTMRLVQVMGVGLFGKTHPHSPDQRSLARWEQAIMRRVGHNFNIQMPSASELGIVEEEPLETLTHPTPAGSVTDGDDSNHRDNGSSGYGHHSTANLREDAAGDGSWTAASLSRSSGNGPSSPSFKPTVNTLKNDAANAGIRDINADALEFSTVWQYVRSRLLGWSSNNASSLEHERNPSAYTDRRYEPSIMHPLANSPSSRTRRRYRSRLRSVSRRSPASRYWDVSTVSSLSHPQSVTAMWMEVN
ncbi:hypothetical protein CANCADRAFT_126788 [Tortispora caseinolytica NRRL Y-17796]|uniref:Uncharacterized protein n=1 Tax=Tortispora caseinolytica NRRL Y-17796 TaxID=767744 RepID=A0A1E4TA85_9ASCO|nr:hypothetical protein CANCADRAFT_126788 [Tortispora caseinolytica NRRL Y-17796]